jgi:hypothetical protein
MDRYAIFGDAGYFFAAGAQAAFGHHSPTISRKQVSLKSPQAMVEAICAQAATSANGIPLLRMYWYDAMPGPRMSLDQSTLAMLPGVKLRLGALNSAGEQKGVDSLIVTDLIDLARNGAISDAVVISGDEDLRIAFQVAQSFGVRVHILAAGDPTRNVSSSLQMEADSVASLDAAWFANQFNFIAPVAAPSTVQPIAATPAAAAAPVKVSAASAAAPKALSLDEAATAVITVVLGSLVEDQVKQLAEHFTQSRTVPPEYDRQYIAKVSAALSGRRLDGAELRHIRGIFVTAVKAAVSGQVSTPAPGTTSS